MCIDLPQNVVRFAEDIVRDDAQLHAKLQSTDALKAGLLLHTRTREDDEDGFVEDTYWDRLQDELYRLLCTKDPHYRELRTKLADAHATTSRFVIPAISAAIGSVIGLGAGVITPFVALALLTVFKVGTSAWCSVRARPQSPVDNNGSEKNK